MQIRRFPLLALGCVVVLGLLAAPARAQVALSPFGMMGANPGFGGGTVMPQQMGMMMSMRMMQGFGGQGIQSGVANPIMNGGYGSVPQLYNDSYYNGSMAGNNTANTGKKHSKRDEARAARAEKKRAAAAAKVKKKPEKVAKKPRKKKDQT